MSTVPTESTETQDTPVLNVSRIDFRTIHQSAMKETAADTSGVDIHGKRYKTVAKRVEIFRRNFGPLARLRISECDIGNNAVRMTAVIELRAEGGVWELVAEGRAEEVRTDRGINSTSALEVCETSAYGRALANFGLHGGEFASANEVETAIEQQKSLKDDSGKPPGWNKQDTQQVTLFNKRILNAASKNDDRTMLDIWHEASEDHAFATAVWVTLPKPIQHKIQDLKGAA